MKRVLLMLGLVMACNAWALPPQVEADGLMLEIKTQMDEGDYSGAVQNFARIEQLRVRVPATFSYHYGLALAGTGQWVKAQAKLDRYLTDEGAGGKFYKEALAKYNEIRILAKREAEGKAATAVNLKKLAALGLSLGQALPGEQMVALAGPGEAPFAIGKYEVTQGQWRAVMGSNPSHFDSCGDDCPVEKVSWNDVQEYLRKLNAQTGKQYRLPSEAEWEYACRGGGQQEYCGSDNVDAVAWYDGNSGNKTHAVGQKQANGYGLHDMSGNVWEWVQDKYDNEHDRRVLRGGSWYHNSQYARAANRGGSVPASRIYDYGFRLARTLP